MMDNRTLAGAAESCNNEFSALLSLALLRDHPEKVDLAEAVEEERARFRLWTSNIGAFAKHHASLDYRLRESERVRSLVLSQLDLLHAASSRLSGTLQSDKQDSNDAPTSNEDGFSELYRPLAGLSEESDFDAEKENLEGMRSAIDRLYRLAKAIRQPGITSQASKANQFNPRDENGIDEIASFETYSKDVIRQMCSEAPGYLVHRLAAANASRRRLFLYRRKHQDILHGHEHSHKSPSPIASRVGTRSVPSIVPKADARQSSTILDGRPHVTPSVHAQSSIARATSFVESQFKPATSSKAATSIGGTSIASMFCHSRLPPPPKVPKSRQQFECPYCCQLVSTTILKKTTWRQHVMKDLEPYVCIFEDCSQPDHKFRDQNAWSTHLRSHAMRWSCRLPGHARGSGTMTFNSADAYAAHLEEHGSQSKAFNKAQIQLLKRQRGLPDPNPIKVCPLCNVSLADLGQTDQQGKLQNGRGGADQPSSITLASKMQKHVASHLMTIASYSLPWLEETDEDVASDKPLSLASDIDSSDAADEHIVPHRSDSHINLIEEFGDLNFGDDDAPPDEHIEGEWDFIKHTPYDGQESDEILTSFVRKYHVEMAFTGSAKREPFLPCTHMPLGRNTDFFGREDALEFLERQLCSDLYTADSKTTLKTCSLYGPAGIGKTQVAVEFVYRHMDKFDAVFWVHADEASKLIEDVNRITGRLGLVDEASADSGDQALTRDLFKRWLGNPEKASHSGSQRANWLLVLDHVIDSAVLDQFWPTERECGAILITSRRSMPWPPERYPSQTLDRFTPMEGASFMCRLLGHEVSPEEHQCASLISAKVRGVPYALRHLTKWIMGEGLTFSEFLAQNHTREDKKLQRKMRGELARFVVAEEHSFLEAAFESIKHSRPLLDVLSMLDPDKIPEHILSNTSSHVFISGYPDSPASLQDALQELLKYSLVTKSPTSATYFIHRIVQDAVRKQMSPLYSRDVYNTCVLLLSAQWPFHTFTWRHGISRWPQCEELFPHIIRLRRLSSTILTNEYHLYGAYLYAKLWCDCGWYCHERGRTRESDDFSSVAQRLCEELKTFYPLSLEQQQAHLPTERDINDILAEIHHNRGVMANEINHPVESLEYLSRFNSMMVRDLGSRQSGTDMRLALSFNELGCAYMLRNDYSRAEMCFEQSISSMEKLDNYERWQVSLPGVNLGVVYWLRERYTDAVNVLTRGLRDREKKFGSNDQESFITGRFLYTLGNVHESLQNYDTSLEYHQRSLNHYRNTLGSAHHRTADAFVRITKHFMRLGQLSEALALINKAIHIYHNFESAFEAETARAKFYKSKVLRQAGNIAEADRERFESVKWYWELKGQNTIGEKELDDADFDLMVVFWSR